MRNEIEKEFNINAFNIYGLTEIIGPGVAHECIEKKVYMSLKTIFYGSYPS